MSKKGKTGPENYVQNIGERKVGEGIRKMAAFILNPVIGDVLHTMRYKKQSGPIHNQYRPRDGVKPCRPDLRSSSIGNGIRIVLKKSSIAN